MNKISDFYRSPAFAIFAEVYSIYKSHPKKVFAVIIFHIWVYGLAFHHIKEAKDILEVFMGIF